MMTYCRWSDVLPVDSDQPGGGEVHQPHLTQGDAVRVGVGRQQPGRLYLASPHGVRSGEALPHP